MRRIPIRLRVTLAFGLVMAAVLAGTGLLVYLRLESGLDSTINQGLRSRAGDLAGLVQQADTGLRDAGRSPLTERGESFAQVLGRQGQVLDATPAVRGGALLDPEQQARAFRSPAFFERSAVPGSDEPARLLASPVTANGRRVVVVVGASLGERNSTLERLRELLRLGGGLALLLACVAGYGAVAAALRPVESMRRRAAAISPREPGRRLPVPVARDELQRLGTTLNSMLERLETAFAREREFVADASHELRTPLAILRTELDVALRSGRTVAELRAALASASEETDRVVQLAEDLLVIARSDQGRLPVRRAAVSAEEVLGGVRERFERRAADQRRELVVADADGVELSADRLRLEQGLGNLVDNALRHGQGAITLSAGRVNGGVELRVSDHGAGFPAGFEQDAFRRFTRGERARTGGGAGLGLAIVAAIAEAHGGSAGARGGSDGAEVWMLIPDRERPARPTRR